MRKNLLSLGHGFSASALAARLLPDGWTIWGTTRAPEKMSALESQGVRPLLWDGPEVAQVLANASHILTSVAPGPEGDPVLARFGNHIAQAAPHLEWAGYLSTTGVYGDHGGGWVDENTPLTPTTDRGRARVAAEDAWRAIPNLPLHIFRLAGIYGPGRSALDRVQKGMAQQVIKPGQVFSRIHVEDIAQVLAASIAQPNPGSIYNLCDDDPAPPQDVIAHAADLLALPRPPEVPFDQATLSPMARSFYAENKRVRNDRIKDELGVKLLYPTYREGLAGLLRGV